MPKTLGMHLADQERKRFCGFKDTRPVVMLIGNRATDEVYKASGWTVQSYLETRGWKSEDCIVVWLTIN
jgi:hypothetical protein